jgi:hypothetical protein
MLGSKEEVKSPPLTPSNSTNSNIFGIALTDLMEKQQKELPNLQIPKILSTLSEGIFVVCCDVAIVSQYTVS